MTSQFSIEILEAFLLEKGYNNTSEMSEEDKDEVIRRVRVRTIEWINE